MKPEINAVLWHVPKIKDGRAQAEVHRALARLAYPDEERFLVFKALRRWSACKARRHGTGESLDASARRAGFSGFAEVARLKGLD